MRFRASEKWGILKVRVIFPLIASESRLPSLADRSGEYDSEDSCRRLPRVAVLL